MDISLAALLGENIYNFGELLQHPIVSTSCRVMHAYCITAKPCLYCHMHLQLVEIGLSELHTLSLSSLLLAELKYNQDVIYDAREMGMCSSKVVCELAQLLCYM